MRYSKRVKESVLRKVLPAESRSVPDIHPSPIPRVPPGTEQFQLKSQPHCADDAVDLQEQLLRLTYIIESIKYELYGHIQFY